MAKRSQQDSGEERVTAKSRPMMNLSCQDAVVRVVFNFSEPGEETLRKSRSMVQLDKLLQKVAKRVQEQKDEEKIVLKFRPTAMNLSSTIPASSSSAKNLITSSDPGKHSAAGKPASRTRRNSKPDEAPSSQVKLKDENLGGLMDDSAGKQVSLLHTKTAR